MRLRFDHWRRLDRPRATGTVSATYVEVLQMDRPSGTARPTLCRPEELGCFADDFEAAPIEWWDVIDDSERGLYVLLFMGPGWEALERAQADAKERYPDSELAEMAVYCVVK